MRAALVRPAADTFGAVRAPSAGTIALAASAAILLAALLAGGGADDDRLFWHGVVAALAAAAAVAASALGVLARPRLGAPELATVGLLAASVVWTGLSVVWSIEPDRSWGSFNRGLVYVTLIVLGILVGASVGRAPRVFAAVLAASFGVVVLWALAGKVAPALGPENARSARLREPIGYWNALALVTAMSLPLWLWLAARRVHAPLVRAAGTVLLMLTLVATALTTSRGGVVVGSVAIGAWLVLGRPRLESVGALLLALPVAVAIAWWALQQSGLAQAGAAEPAARGDGALLGLVLVVSGLAVGAVAYWAARRETAHPLTEEQRDRLTRLAAGAVAVGVVVGALLLVVRVGNPVTWAGDRLDDFRNPPSEQVTNAPDRIVQFSSNHRWTWWGEAGRIFRDHPLEGTGAGTFALARRPLRDDTQAPLAPHSIALQALSETGVVGFGLLLGFAVAAAWSVRRALARLPVDDRAAAAALAAALVAYVAHSLIDIGWEYVAVAAPFFLALGVLLGSGRGQPAPARDRRPLAAVVAAAIAATVLASLAAPWLAQRRVDSAYAALDRGNLPRAIEEAQEAASLNPLAVEPLHVHATAEELRGDLATAERLYADAVELQPDNPETWYELGLFEFHARGDLGAALRYLDHSYALDAYGPSGPVLDEVRAAIEQQSAG
jgi:O-antigen ligase